MGTAGDGFGIIAGASRRAGVTGPTLLGAGIATLLAIPLPTITRSTRRFWARDSGASSIVTTEKDAVKIDARDMIAVEAEMVIDAAVLAEIIARAGIQ